MTATITISLPATQNAKFGFYGTIRTNKRRAWAAAITEFYNATRCNPEAIAVWLDSRDGRHFADKVNEMAALFRTFEDHTIEDAVALCVKEHFKYSICGKTGFVKTAIAWYAETLTSADSEAA
jgi:hypothetical protein